MVNLRGRSLTKIIDLTNDELKHLLKLSHSLKAQKYNGVVDQPLKGKNIILLFQKDSTRTRAAFEVAAMDLGMGVTYFGPTGSQFGKKESVLDSAIVLGRFYDGIQFRGYDQETAEELAENAGVPVWNGLTDQWHPTQMIADFMTMQEELGHDLRGKKLVYFGDARNNLGNSLMVTAAKLGMHFVAAAPKELHPDKELVKQCEQIASETGGSVTLTDDHVNASENADVVYTDVWVSMGEPDEKWKERVSLLQDFQVTKEKMGKAKDTAIFLHCLPSFHDMGTTIGAEKAKVLGDEFPAVANGEFEVTNEVFISSQSKVFEEAENRMHSIKAIILATIGQ